ncbi:MAG: TonB-dependent receptor [Gammaproteobacteria bacterium]
MAVPAGAQDREPEEEAATLERVSVTGSRIARPDFESASPIVTVPAEAFDETGSPTVEAALNKFPQFVPSADGTSNNPSANGRAQLDLRGLGSEATLVLIDGRRLVPASGTGVPDVNIIPPSLIESVEIVTGGASAVYGSDAVAGVVNFKLKPYYEGIEFGGFYGQTGEGDSDRWDVNVTAGTQFAGGRGSVYGFVSRSERDLLTYGERDFARYPLFYLGPGAGITGPQNGFVPAGSGTIEEGGAFFFTGPGQNSMSQAAFDSVFASYGFPPGSVLFQSALGFNADGTLFTQGTFAPGSVVNFRGERDPFFYNSFRYTYNFAPPNALQLPLERTSFFGRGTFDVSPTTRVFAEALYADYSVTQQLAPTPAFQEVMPATNPYIPADLKTLLDSRPNPGAPLFWYKRLSEAGPRVAENRYDTYQATVGLESDVFDFWALDAYVQYGASDQKFVQSGNVLRSKMEELTFAPDGGVSVCGGFDAFGLGSISQECMDYITVGGSNTVDVSQLTAEVSMEGPVMSLPAGDLRMAFGVFYKRDEYSYAADPIASEFLPDGRSDILGFNASDDVDGDESNTDVYVEALVPLLSDVPGAKSLELGLGFRYADYQAAGGADSYKAELLYRPVESLRLRGSYQQAIRAPSVFELFQPQLPANLFNTTSAGDITDPCTAGSPERTGPDAEAVEALCLAQGVPADVLPDFVYRNDVIQGFAGGNPDLEPEDADTLTLGAAWTSGSSADAFGRWQASVDWYRIEVKDAIQQVSADEVIDLCFDPQTNPTYSPDNQWCQYFDRIDGIGEIVDVYGINRNVAGTKTTGVDFQLDWQRDLGPGTAGLNWLVSWLDSYERSAGAGAPTVEYVNTIGAVGAFGVGGSLPEWKWTLAASYAWRGLDVTARWRYVDAMDDGEFADFEVPSRDYVDLYASYTLSPGILDGLTIGAGVENLSDEDPPIFPSYVQANTDTSQYDVFGRRYFLRLNYGF